MYFKACTKCFPVHPCTRTPSYYTARKKNFPVLLAQQNFHKTLPSTTLYYKACTVHFPELLRTTSHTSRPPSPAAATLHGKRPRFLLRLPPQHESQATFMQPLRAALHRQLQPLYTLLSHVLLCDNVLLWYVMLCYLLLSDVLLSHVLLCDVLLYDVLVCVMYCYDVSCYVVLLCDVLVCGVLLCDVLLCDVLLCHVLLCGVLLCDILLCYVLLCDVLLCGVLLCIVLYVTYRRCYSSRMT